MADASASSLSAAELVACAQRGNQSAFGELTRRYRPRIYALALHLTGDAHDADDVAQETFLRAFRKLGEFRAASEFYTWIYRIAVNRALNLRRDNSRRRSSNVPMDDPRVALAVQVDSGGDPRRAAELRQSYSRLVAALDGLSPSLRSTVVLVALQGLTHDEAGAVLGCPSGTIAWRIHESRRELAEALERPDPHEEEHALPRFVPVFGQ
ncbi:MAG TPA: sigma-70 family RNA polymerase sigma factor [Polyangia bacterium]|nr:sigma-70 family RNA polymerase sigma factor [Polyangia bacterium]